ncbi:hypothetical protein Malapachy_2917 [Malassezia pachydermatis]|uniref:Zinc finger CHCC-type domain-containing protein n=1 Tax=Malassezia pachydermatis TaxID=77020 RepID=A0A0M8MSV5_9BASI|nr:hypothetical protein Malapachy_2917 [Malassezia pachydermatis]KOS16077.1 hypothetical protein Malapachy_2917 [Malassezia pachydermatis]
MLSRALIAPTRALRAQVSGVRSFSVYAPIFSSAPTKQAPAQLARGEFVRPRVKGGSIQAQVEMPIAKPEVPPEVQAYGLDQAPNHPSTWSLSQRPKSEAMKGPRFEQMDPRFQPQSLSAMELINNHPIQMSTKRVVSCDGGEGPLGHPRVYINLCSGTRFQKVDTEEH